MAAGSIDALPLRPVTAADLDAVARLQEASIMALGITTYGEAGCRAWARFGREQRHHLLEQGQFYLIEDRTEVVAVGGFAFDRRDEDAAWVSYLFVAPARARQGLGQRLVRTIESATLAAGRPRLLVWSSLNAAPFYQALGYCRLRAGRWPITAGLELAYLLMAKERSLIGAVLAAEGVRC